MAGSVLGAVQQCQRDEDKLKVIHASGGVGGNECPHILHIFQQPTPMKFEAAQLLAQRCGGITAADLTACCREFDQAAPQAKFGVLQAFAPRLQDPQNKSYIVSAFYSQQDQQTADLIITSAAGVPPPPGYGPPPPGYGPPPPGYGPPPAHGAPPMMVPAGPPIMVPAGPPMMDRKAAKKLAKQEKKMYKKQHKHSKKGFGFGSFSFSL